MRLHLPRAILAATVVVVLGSANAQAGIIMTIYDDGTNLYMTATGSYDLTNAALIGSTSLGANAAVFPLSPTYQVYGWETAGGTSANYAASYSGFLTSSGVALPADSTVTTIPFFFWITSPGVGRIVFETSAPTTGVVNESAVFLGYTLASLGMVSGESIQVTWGLQGTDEVGTITVGAPIPEPTTLLLLGTGLGAVAARRRLKKRA